MERWKNLTFSLAGVLQGDTPIPFVFTIVLEYALRLREIAIEDSKYLGS